MQLLELDKKRLFRGSPARNTPFCPSKWTGEFWVRLSRRQSQKWLPIRFGQSLDGTYWCQCKGKSGRGDSVTEAIFNGCSRHME